MVEVANRMIFVKTFTFYVKLYQVIISFAILNLNDSDQSSKMESMLHRRISVGSVPADREMTAKQYMNIFSYFTFSVNSANFLPSIVIPEHFYL